MNFKEKIEIILGAFFCVAALIIFIEAAYDLYLTLVGVDAKVLDMCAGGVVTPSIPFTVFNPIRGNL